MSSKLLNSSSKGGNCADSRLTALGVVTEDDSTSPAPRAFKLVPRPRIRLQDLASPSAQIETYGSIQWQSEFVKLRSLKHFPGITGNGADLHDKIWRKLKAPRFKLFQEAFCHPDDWIVPRIERCEWNINPTEDFDIPVLACLISPERVPDKLLFDLALKDSAQTNTLESAWLRCSVETITKVKLAWDSATPLLPGRHQALVVCAPSQEILEYYPEQLPALSPTAIGVVLNLTRVQAATRQLSPGLPTQSARQCAFDSSHTPLLDGALLILQMPPPQDDLWLAFLQLWQDIDESLVNRSLKWREAAIARKQSHSPELVAGLQGRLNKLASEVSKQKGQRDELTSQVAPTSGKNAKQDLLNLKRLLIQLLTNLLRGRSITALPSIYLGTCYAEKVLRGLEERSITALTLFGSDHFLFSERCQIEHVGSQVEGILRRLKLNPQVVSELRIAPFPKFTAALQCRYSAFERALRSQNLQASQQALGKYIFALQIVRMFVDIEFQRAATSTNTLGYFGTSSICGNNIVDHALAAFPKDLETLANWRVIFREHRENIGVLDKLSESLISALYCSETD